MIKYTLKENPITRNTYDYVADYLSKLGINKVDSFSMGPSDDDELDPMLLDNMELLIDRLHKGFTDNKNFFVQVDPDMDGYTSASIFCSFFLTVFPNAKIEYRIQESKEHGVIQDSVPITADYIIIPDAGSNQTDEQRHFAEQGRQVLIMDHHIVDDYFRHPNVVIVNNQLSDRFPNKFLSGAGVVYKVIQAYSRKYLKGKTEYLRYRDLAATGIIADMMDSRELDNNFLITVGLANIENPFLKAMLNKQSFKISSVTNPTKIDIAFYIAPLVNAMVRYGTMEEKDLMFRAMALYRSDEIFETEYRNNQRVENLYDYTARIAANVKSKQDSAKKKAMQFLFNNIEANDLDSHEIIIVETSADDEIQIAKTMTGLVAMGLNQKYKKPVLVVRPKSIDKKTFMAGSLRATAKKGFPSFKDFLTESKLVSYAQGHDMAAGVMFPTLNYEPLLKYADEKLKDIDWGSTDYEVDYVFDNEVDKRMLFQFADNQHLYGNSIPEPLFAFEFTVDRRDINIYVKKTTTINVFKDGMSYVIFKSPEIAEQLKTLGNNIKVTAVGKAVINEWQGRRSVQVVCEEMEVSNSNKAKRILF